MGFAWDGDAGEWTPLGVVSDRAINNFPPARMPNGEWGMKKQVIEVVRVPLDEVDLLRQDRVDR
jgi:hypothetical protein